jgi:GNAT superfamily N-acetyltransferase
VVLPRPDGDAELDGLFVEPGLWKRGIGRLLVRHAERQAMGEGATSLCVVANPHSSIWSARRALASAWRSVCESNYNQIIT